MATDPRKRQRKLERRKAKQQAERRELARRDAGGMAARMAQAAAAPILHCCATTDLWEQGIGHVLISRQLDHGNVAFADFLVDMYCLGVKNVIAEVAPRQRYQRDLYDKVTRQYAVVSLRPECARKLVEGAVQYALDLGFPPHADYRKASPIFGDIDAGACPEQYAYGKDGKPFFIAGPYDSPNRCNDIMRTLQHRCGPDGYHFLMPAEGPLPI